jgi:ribosome-associated protein
MSRKLKKGYFVQGQFVAEGSALDLELKAELKGTDASSRTDLKRESTELQALGEQLLTLRAELFDGLALPEKLADAVAEARRITNFEGKRRQMQFIGKLMRKLDDEQVEQIRQALGEQHGSTAAEVAALHEAEQWRDALVADDDALARWLDRFPGTDAQQLRSLVRQARKDAKPEKPGLAPRHGRAYREIFQLVRSSLRPGDDSPDGEADDGHDDDA